jgi:hypothetical protein
MKLITTNSDGKAVSVSIPVYEGVTSALDNPAAFDTLTELRAVNFLSQTGNVSTQALGLDAAVRAKLALLQAMDVSLLSQLTSLSNIITELQTRFPSGLSANGAVKVAVVETDPKVKTIQVSNTVIPLSSTSVPCTHCTVNNPNSVGIRVSYNSTPGDYYLLGAGQSEPFIVTNVTALSVVRDDAVSGNIPVSYHAFVRQ